MKIKILLSVPNVLYRELERERNRYGHTSVQELVLAAVREHLFGRVSSHSTESSNKKRKKRGRPRGFDPSNIVSRTRVFSKKGKGFDL